MDLSFAAAPEAGDGDWGEDENAEDRLPDKKLLGRGSRSRSRSPQAFHKEQSVPPQLALTSGYSNDSNSAGLHPPKSKIHSNPRTRYFVIKSNNHKNLVLSVENDVWATQRQNEEKLNEALYAAPHVILVFSVNMSGCFQGYAKMAGRVGASAKTDVFKGYGRAFDIRWLRLRDLEFSEVAHIQNPWNDHQPVKISRDGQELPNEVGARLCEMADLRVFQGDPGGYVTDEREVETGGFEPLPTPARSAVQSQALPTEGAGLAMQPGCPPMPSYSAHPSHHRSMHHPGSGPPPFGTAPPLGVGSQPPMHPWGPWGPHLQHGAWNYPPWGPGFDSSSYYSDSYTSSSSSEEEEAIPPQPLAQLPGAPILAPISAPSEQQVVAPAPCEALPTVVATAPARSRKESSKKAKKDKDHKEVSTSGHSMAANKATATETPSNEKKSKKEKTIKEEKESSKAKRHERKRKQAPVLEHEVGKAPTTHAENVARTSNGRERRRRREGTASKPHHSSHDRTRRRDDTLNARTEASVQSQWQVGVGAPPVAHSTHTAPLHAYRAPPPPGWAGYSPPPLHQPHPAGVYQLPLLGHAPPPRAPPSDWHGASPMRG